MTVHPFTIYQSFRAEGQNLAYKLVEATAGHVFRVQIGLNLDFPSEGFAQLAVYFANQGFTDLLIQNGLENSAAEIWEQTEDHIRAGWLESKEIETLLQISAQKLVSIGLNIVHP